MPAAWPTFQPLKVGDPAGCGSGVLLLAAATCFPEWAVRLQCVIFQGSDIDALCCRLARINCALYGLNGYALRLAEAVRVVAGAQQNRQNAPAAPPKSVGTVIKHVAQAHPQPADEPMPPPEELSFESLFRRVAQPSVADDVLA